MTPAERHIVLERRGALGIATLNRPEALNAMTLEMYHEFARELGSWGRDSSIRVVLLRGAGERAFCAGGDVRALYSARNAPLVAGDFRLTFFADEYRFFRAVHRFPKPFVTLTHGITMGGGAGLSVNARYRIASESLVFAMPEVCIGSITDAGATRFLNMCPGKLGLYLALTGTHITAADAMYCGLFTHFIPQEKFEALIDAVDEGDIEASLQRFAEDSGKSALESLRPAIDYCFGRSSVEAIVEALQEQRDEWARAALAAMHRMSPLSLKIVFRQLQRGMGMDIEQALTLEYRVIRHILAGNDFYEGVRSVVIDKDRSARWHFASLADVSDHEVDRHFENIGAEELVFSKDVAQ